MEGSAEQGPLEEEEELGLWLWAEVTNPNPALGPAEGTVAAVDTLVPGAPDFCANRVPTGQKNKRNNTTR